MAHTRPHLARAAALLAATLLLQGCNPAILDPQGPIAAANRTILFGSLAIMLVIVIPTIVATLAFAWWFRASNTRAKYLPRWVYSGQLELLVWSVPLLTITLLGGVAWIGSHALDPARPITAEAEPIEIQVVSLDWKWLFIYPAQGIASVNQLAIPAATPVHFRLTSGSVLNAFFIPQLGSMIYTMNGMATQLWLHADKPGTFQGLSSHYSGNHFSDMHFQVRALPKPEFDAWVAQTKSTGPTLDPGTYATLAKQGTTPPATYAAIEADLFDKLVKQEIPPAPGPTPTTSPHATPQAANQASK